MFAAKMKVLTGSYASSLIYFSGLMVVAFIVSILIRFEINKLRKQNAFKEQNAEELVIGTYGALTAFLYRMTNGKILLSLVGAMLGSRIILGLTKTILFNLAGNPYSLAVFLSGAFITAFPGIAIQLILIPAIVKALKGSGLIMKY